MGLENLRERVGARVLQIEMMGAIFAVRLNFMRSAFGVIIVARVVKFLTSTKASQSSRRFGGELNVA